MVLLNFSSSRDLFAILLLFRTPWTFMIKCWSCVKRAWNKHFLRKLQQDEDGIWEMWSMNNSWTSSSTVSPRESTFIYVLPWMFIKTLKSHKHRKNHPKLNQGEDNESKIEPQPTPQDRFQKHNQSCTNKSKKIDIRSRNPKSNQTINKLRLFVR